MGPYGGNFRISLKNLDNFLDISSQPVILLAEW